MKSIFAISCLLFVFGCTSTKENKPGNARRVPANTGEVSSLIFTGNLTRVKVIVKTPLTLTLQLEDLPLLGGNKIAFHGTYNAPTEGHRFNPFISLHYQAFFRNGQQVPYGPDLTTGSDPVCAVNVYQPRFGDVLNALAPGQRVDAQAVKKLNISETIRVDLKEVSPYYIGTMAGYFGNREGYEVPPNTGFINTNKFINWHFDPSQKQIWFVNEKEKSFMMTGDARNGADHDTRFLCFVARDDQDFYNGNWAGIFSKAFGINLMLSGVEFRKATEKETYPLPPPAR